MWHRNHLGIISANPIVNTGGIYTYDFSSSESQVHGGLMAHKEIGTDICKSFMSVNVPTGNFFDTLIEPDSPVQTCDAPQPKTEVAPEHREEPAATGRW